MLCLTGSGVPKDGARCGALWRAAAEAGLAAAQASMGMCHVNGRLGCHVDDQAAVGWYERAARQGHAEAADLLRAWRKYGRFGLREGGAPGLKTVDPRLRPPYRNRFA